VTAAAAAEDGRDPLLAVEDIHAYYGKSQIFFGLSLPCRGAFLDRRTSARIEPPTRSANIGADVGNKVKPIGFLDGSLDDLREFPPTARREAGYQLDRVQRGLGLAADAVERFRRARNSGWAKRRVPSG
jgi:hypothetical protein